MGRPTNTKVLFMGLKSLMEVGPTGSSSQESINKTPKPRKGGDQHIKKSRHKERNKGRRNQNKKIKTQSSPKKRKAKAKVDLPKSKSTSLAGNARSTEGRRKLLQTLKKSKPKPKPNLYQREKSHTKL